MVVRQKIISIRYPERIRGIPGERFEIKAHVQTEGEGRNTLWCGLLLNRDLVGWGVTDEPWGPGASGTWTCTLEVRRELPHGTALHFTVVVGHHEDSIEVQDDSSEFTITVVKAWWERVPKWAWAVGLGAPLVVVGTTAVRR